MKQYWIEHWDTEDWQIIARRHDIPVLLKWDLAEGWHSLFIRDKRTLLKMLKLGADDIHYIDRTWKNYLG